MCVRQWLISDFPLSLSVFSRLSQLLATAALHALHDYGWGVRSRHKPREHRWAEARRSLPALRRCPHQVLRDVRQHRVGGRRSAQNGSSSEHCVCACACLPLSASVLMSVFNLERQQQGSWEEDEVEVSLFEASQVIDNSDNSELNSTQSSMKTRISSSTFSILNSHLGWCFASLHSHLPAPRHLNVKTLLLPPPYRFSSALLLFALHSSDISYFYRRTLTQEFRLCAYENSICKLFVLESIGMAAEDSEWISSSFRSFRREQRKSLSTSGRRKLRSCSPFQWELFPSMWLRECVRANLRGILSIGVTIWIHDKPAKKKNIQLLFDGVILVVKCWFLEMKF